MMETGFQVLARKLVEAFQKPKGGNTTLKEFLNTVKPEELEQEEPPIESGGADFIGGGGDPYESQLGPGMSSPEPMSFSTKSGGPQRPSIAAQDMGPGYAPSNPYGATPPEGQDRIRRDYEQQAFGLDGLREAFMTEGMPPNIDVGLQSHQGPNIAQLNALLFKEAERNKMNRTPSPGWR